MYIEIEEKRKTRTEEHLNKCQLTANDTKLHVMGTKSRRFQRLITVVSDSLRQEKINGKEERNYKGFRRYKKYLRKLDYADTDGSLLE